MRANFLLEQKRCPHFLTDSGVLATSVTAECITAHFSLIVYNALANMIDLPPKPLGLLKSSKIDITSYLITRSISDSLFPELNLAVSTVLSLSTSDLTFPYVASFTERIRGRIRWRKQGFSNIVDVIVAVNFHVLRVLCHRSTHNPVLCLTVYNCLCSRVLSCFIFEVHQCHPYIM